MPGAPLAKLLLPAKSTAEFRTGSWGGGTRAQPVHGLKCRAEAVLGSRWRLQTAQPACSPGTEPGSSFLLGWAPGCPQPSLVGEDAGGPSRKSRNKKKNSKSMYPLMRGEERTGGTSVLRPLQTGLSWHQLLLSCLLPKGSNPRDVGVCSCQHRGSAGPRHPPHRPSAPACSCPNPAQAAEPPQGGDFGMLRGWRIAPPHTLLCPALLLADSLHLSWGQEFWRLIGPL